MSNLFRALGLVVCVFFAPAAFSNPASDSADSVKDAVNVNVADAARIADVLEGVGASRAEAIVRYRKEHGGFQDIYELANVKGIGERTVALNEERIRLRD